MGAGDIGLLRSKPAAAKHACAKIKRVVDAFQPDPGGAGEANIRVAPYQVTPGRIDRRAGIAFAGGTALAVFAILLLLAARTGDIFAPAIPGGVIGIRMNG